MHRSRSTMSFMTPHKDEVTKKYRAYIECDECGKSHPTLRCKQCKRAYYCSAECQRSDWTKRPHGHKTICDSPKPTPSDEATVPPAIVGKNTACGICWEEPMVTSVVLPQCGHAFCFPCLMKWQGYPSRFVDPTNNTPKVCPLCRDEIQVPVWEVTMVEANALYDQAVRCQLEGPETNERSKLLSRALDKVKMILELDDWHFGALQLQAKIMLHIAPTEAIRLIRHIIDLDRTGHNNCRAFAQKCQRHEQAVASGNQVLADRIMDEIHLYYGHVEPWPRSLGDGPEDLIAIRIVLAQAYEATGQHAKARDEYMELWFLHRQSDARGQDETALEEAYQVLLGLTRCPFHMGEYEDSLYSAELALLLNRQYPGLHRLAAQAQRAIARRDKGKPNHRIMVGESSRETCTLHDAVRTMYRGMVYETLWGDEANDEENKSYLSKLLAEIEGKEKV